MWELSLRDSVVECGSAESGPLEDLSQAENRFWSSFTSFEIHCGPRIEQFIRRSKATQDYRAGAGGGHRTHELPGWKPGAFPLGYARLKIGPGSGS